MTTLMTPKSKIPTIELPLVSGGTFNMAEASPENFQIIVVYRGLHCPKCKAQLKAIDPRVADIRADGHDIVAVSMDTEERAQQAKTDWELEDLPIAHSLELLDAKSLGLFISDSISDKEPKIFSEPGIFVVRPDGTLYAEIVQNTPFGRPDMEDIVDGLNFVVKNDYPTRGTSVA
ncbi:thioredoxin peroxidase [Algimonas arctica]|uniref:Thioredoxin peroxidase n=1 Tax=Algimonas arctica TaxID=1479486 RepID=A0A8J3CSG0_9PROT|nr:redoxin domain-containing protein [Algimonas arctica]GHB02596.1 thioredoxin peroxidase [Algimonas arctica]